MLHLCDTDQVENDDCLFYNMKCFFRAPVTSFWLNVVRYLLRCFATGEKKRSLKSVEKSIAFTMVHAKICPV